MLYRCNGQHPLKLTDDNLHLGKFSVLNYVYTISSLYRNHCLI